MILNNKIHIFIAHIKL